MDREFFSKRKETGVFYSFRPGTYLNPGCIAVMYWFIAIGMPVARIVPLRHSNDGFGNAENGRDRLRTSEIFTGNR